MRIISELNYIDDSQSQRETRTIGELFCQQAILNSQKIAVELDEQCITYGELLFLAQRVAAYILSEYNLKIGEIVCQCMERSISTVS